MSDSVEIMFSFSFFATYLHYFYLDFNVILTQETKDIQDKLKECKEDAECKMQYIICVQSKLALCDDEVIKKQVQEQLKSFLQ